MFKYATMKKIIIILLAICSTSILGQFKNQSDNIPSIKDSFTQSSPSSMFLGFLNSDNFRMSHSVDMSFSTFGGQSIMLGSYTGSMFYKLSDNLNIAVDASLVTSPYSSLGNEYSKSINGIYITRAQINYNISKDTRITLQYFNPVGGLISPYGYWGRRTYFDDYYDTIPFNGF